MEISNCCNETPRPPANYRTAILRLETNQGIPHARNRAIDESLDSTFLAFIDADELPYKTWLVSALHGLTDYFADCVGGEIVVDIPNRPKWLSDSVILFLGKVDHGSSPFPIVDRSTRQSPN